MTKDNKIISLQISASEAARINHYKKLENLSQSAFIRDAIEQRCEILKEINAGNAFIPVKNPALAGFTPDQEDQIREIMNKAQNDLGAIGGEAAEDLLNGVRNFMIRSFNKTPGERALIKAKGLLDEEFEGRIQILDSVEWSEADSED